MIGTAWPLMRAALHAMDPESAHDLTLSALQRLPLPDPAPDDPRLAVDVFGLRFPNPVGLAAGFDKDVRVPDQMLKLGFGFTEAGSITPLPQAGNPKPRVFRLPEAKGVVNRLGFNNGGHQAALARVKARAGRPGIVGINVGANKDAADRAADYAAGVKLFAPLASYITVNISSPNTPGLRDLQAKSALDDLLKCVMDARAESGVNTPILLKIAPDLALEDLDDVVTVALARGINGLIVSNTTLARPQSVRDAAVKEHGGLSGAPLFRRATWMLAETALRTEGKLPLIGAGGVHSSETALAKIRAGASLVQIYTALTFEGPGLVADIKRGLIAALKYETVESIASLAGRDSDAVAKDGPGA